MMADPIKEYKKDGKKYYKFKVYTGINPKTGKKSQTTKSGFITKAQAKKARLEIQKAVSDGTYWEEKENKRYKVSEVFDEYLKLKENELKEATIIKYLRTKKYVISKIGDIYIDKLTSTDIIEAIKKSSQGIKSMNEHLLKIKDMFEYAHNLGYTNKNIAFNIPIFKDTNIIENEKVKFLNEKEIRALLHHSKDDGIIFYSAFYLMITSGIRIGELRALTWKDYNGEYIRINKTASENVEYKTIITSPKTKASNRYVRLDESTIKVLNDLKEASEYDYIFSFNGSPMSAGTLKRRLYSLHDRFPNEVPKISCHTLRHTHASLLFKIGVNPKVIQKRMGHADFNTTMNVYTHLFEDFEEDNLNLFFDKLKDSKKDS